MGTDDHRAKRCQITRIFKNGSLQNARSVCIKEKHKSATFPLCDFLHKTGGHNGTSHPAKPAEMQEAAKTNTTLLAAAHAKARGPINPCGIICILAN